MINIWIAAICGFILGNFAGIFLAGVAVASKKYKDDKK